MFTLIYLGCFFGVYVASVYKSAAGDVISDKQLTLAGAIGSIMNGSSRIMWASLQDKYGFKVIYMILLII
jgi:hypothetical protein